jgi:Uma2 family endonuclease
MSDPLAKETEWTWDRYLELPSDKRHEVIGGKLFAMSSPSVRHQRACGALYSALFAHFRAASCQVFIAPLDVKLSERDVVQPDVLVVCDPSKVKENHVEGPPDLVIEVLSPSSLRTDRMHKLRLYAEAGVKEYWIVEPHPPLVEVLLLDGATYRIHNTHLEVDTLASPSFSELKLDLSEIFADFDPSQVREQSPYFRV